MNTFIKVFVGSSTADLAEAANEFAKANKLEIVTANFAFSGAGRVFEIPVLTVVYEKPKRARKKADGKEEESDE